MIVSDRLIFVCWAVWFVFWLVSALFVKRTVQRAGRGWLRVAILVAIASTLYLARRGDGGSSGTLWPRTRTVQVLGEAVTLIGLAITLWARLALGANWSGEVALKEEHELIERGPYRFARHPIYTGILLMLLGTALVAGTAAALLAFAVCGLALWFKARQEERLLTAYFPESYPKYRERVKAFLPFLL